MTQEDKQLLLADLCARLPYGVKISAPDGNQTLVGNICTNGGGKVYTTNMLYNISQVKPYLRPMSSMTEDEVKEFYNVECMDAKVGYIKPTWNWHFTINGIDWLNARHFDVRNLIGKGLALEAPDGMYNNKEEQQ